MLFMGSIKFFDENEVLCIDCIFDCKVFVKKVCDF